MKHFIAPLGRAWALAFAFAACVTPAAATESTGTVVTKTFTTTTADILNPERGWMLFSTGSYVHSISASDASSIYSQGFRVFFTRIDLSPYVTTATLPTSFLNNLTTGFGRMRAAGIKGVVRIIYNYDSSGTDATLAIATGHLQQLAPILKANADVIAYAQAGMIGQWAEWHDSKTLCPGSNPTAACWSSVINALLAAYDPRTMVQVRYPKFIRQWYSQPLGEATRFSGSNQSRIGNHNDCFMSDNTDVGTYQSSVLTLSNPERARVANDSNWTPFGGETCSGFSPQRLGCSNILSEGPTYHLTYLNRYFYQAFMDSWTSGGCFDQVQRSMGYRFVLDSFAMQGTAVVGQSVTATVVLHNEGWSRIFSARRVNVILKNTSTSETRTCVSDQDLRSLDPQKASGTATTFKISCPLGSTSAGTYQVLLSMPDVWAGTMNDARFSVRPAVQDNSGAGQVWDSSTGRMPTGMNLVISAS